MCYAHHIIASHSSPRARPALAPEFEQALAQLEARDLIRLTSEGGRAVVQFKHVLTRDATYESILHTHRMELHRQVAQTLETLYPQRDFDLLLTIARHWLNGGEAARALEAVLPRSRELIYAGRASSLIELIPQLDSEHLTPAQQQERDLALAEAYAARGEYAPARTLREQLLRGADSPQVRAPLLHGVGVANFQLGEYTEAIKNHRAALELAHTLNDPILQAQASGGLGLVYWNLGDTAEAEAYLKESRALATRAGAPFELANAEYNLAGVMMDQGDYAEAIGAAQRALALYENFGHAPFIAHTIQLLGACYYSQGDLDKAAEYYARAIERSQAIGDTLGAALGQGNLGEVYTDRGRFEQAVELYRKAVTQLRLIKHDWLLAIDLAGLANALLKLSTQLPNDRVAPPLDEAHALALEALQIAQRLDSKNRVGIAERVLAEIYQARGDMDRALAFAQQAVASLEPAGQALELKRAQQTLETIRAAAEESSQPTRDAG